MPFNVYQTMVCHDCQFEIFAPPHAAYLVKGCNTKKFNNAVKLLWGGVLQTFAMKLYSLAEPIAV